MKTYEITVSASNTVKKLATSRRGILKVIAGCQGRCSVESSDGEVYFGTVESVRADVKTDMDYLGE